MGTLRYNSIVTRSRRNVNDTNGWRDWNSGDW